jgi:hypothetical protein
MEQIKNAQDLYRKLNIPQGTINPSTGEGISWVKGSPELYLRLATYQPSEK